MGGPGAFLDTLLDVMGCTIQQFMPDLIKVLKLIPDVERRCVLHMAALRMHPFVYTQCCQEPVCFKCKIAGHHSGLTCEEVQRRELEVEVQFCPGCGVPTQKTEGCKEMICHCGTKWEWKGDDLGLTFDTHADEVSDDDG